MILLVIIGFLAGIVTGISPCVLPVLPIVFASGAASALPEDDQQDQPQDQPASAPALAAVGAGSPSGVDRPASQPSAGSDAARTEGRPRPSRTGMRTDRRERRPIAVVAGLVGSFGVFTLLGVWLLTALHLPLDVLRWIGVVVVGLVGLSLLVPAVASVLEYPFVKLSRGRPVTSGGGFVLGVSLGLVFVPCAGPVLAAITVVGGSSHPHIGWSAVLLTIAFCAGIAVPLLVFAILGQRLTDRMPAVRARAVVLRRVIGVLLVVAAVVFATNVTNDLRNLPGYTGGLQSLIENSAAARHALAGVTGQPTTGALSTCDPTSPVLQNCGRAPAIRGIESWLDTPGDRPVALSGLRGRVVLVDFWTYSCINCQRTLPHVEAWYRTYAGAGFTVLGIHTPEFAFEHVRSNVRSAAMQLGVRYPVALDNQYATWDAYQNNYWPAEYLIDAKGNIRHVDFGEGNYSQTETFIRTLLTSANPAVVLPPRTDVPDATPTEQTTPESYLGDDHPSDLSGETIVPNQLVAYHPPSPLPADSYAYDGQWSIGNEASTAGSGASLELNYSAKDVYLVLGGQGSVQVSAGGSPPRTIAVSGVPRLYQLVGPGPYQQASLDLTFTPGVQAYDFTFG